MSKPIRVADDVYDKLTKLKGKDSYSTAIRKLIVPVSNIGKILEFSGKNIIDEEKIKKLKIGWKRWSEKYV